jgi:hypothetical protein
MKDLIAAPFLLVCVLLKLLSMPFGLIAAYLGGKRTLEMLQKLYGED